MTTKPIISDHPPCDGQEWECQCARCGSSCDAETCFDCCGEGFSGHECGEDVCCCLDPEENVICETCDGAGGWWHCVSRTEWCHASPLPGREYVRRGKIEWFVVKREKPHPGAIKPGS